LLAAATNLAAMQNGQSVDQVSNGALDHLLKNFTALLSKSSEPLSDNAEHMHLVELHFLVKK
jgi:hypothetical protein